MERDLQRGLSSLMCDVDTKRGRIEHGFEIGVLHYWTHYCDILFSFHDIVYDNRFGSGSRKKYLIFESLVIDYMAERLGHPLLVVDA